MTTDRTPPQYDLPTVEGAVLRMAVELHPRHLKAGDLMLEIVSHPDDDTEIGIAAEAIRNLREFGLLRDREDGTVEPTPAALRAVVLLAG